MKSSTYTAITPAYNEEAMLPNLIRSMASQTLRPRRWIIIDDGSSDRTAEIIDRVAGEYPWIEPYHLPRHGKRAPGGESAVMRCLRERPWSDSDFLFRVDADVTFEADYVALLMAEFAKNPRLGIAGGTLHEPHRGHWVAASTPEFDASGPSKIYSRECFQAIGGIEGGLGWDTIDEMRALMLGFDSRRFHHIHTYHHRPMQSASGMWRGQIRKGEAAYNAGYSALYMLARAIRHLFDKPWMMGGALMMIGYIRPLLQGQPMLADAELVHFTRTQQWRRLTFSKTLWR
jgi:poly-beta-1,6-N-acetyl-D-glucosamine synthase